jgi:hypothetical protein
VAIDGHIALCKRTSTPEGFIGNGVTDEIFADMGVSVADVLAGGGASAVGELFRFG